MHTHECATTRKKVSMSDLIRYTGGQTATPPSSGLSTWGNRRQGARTLTDEYYRGEVEVMRKHREMERLADEFEMRDFTERASAVMVAGRMRSTHRLTDQGAQMIEDVAADVEMRAQRVPTAAPALANLYNEIQRAVVDGVANFARYGR
jgi:hypothetical protein